MSDHFDLSDHDSAAIYDHMLESTDVDDSLRVQITALKADGFASRGQTLEAELIYLSLWRDIATKCQDVYAKNTDESLVSAGLLYANFLINSSRTDEAQGILLSLWSHFERGNGVHVSSVSLLNQ